MAWACSNSCLMKILYTSRLVPTDKLRKVDMVQKARFSHSKVFGGLSLLSCTREVHPAQDQQWEGLTERGRRRKGVKNAGQKTSVNERCHG
jgi:hypothetical protein